MPEELSAYELERLANIARNQVVLEELGLAGNNSLKTKTTPPVKRSLPKDTQNVEPSRRSRRTTNTPDVYGGYCQLTEAYFAAEEHHAEAAERRRANRPQRNRNKPQTFASEQERENALSEARAEKSRCQRRVADAEKARLAYMAAMDKQRTMPVPYMFNPNHVQPNVGVFPNIVTTQAKSYHTDGVQGQCPVCMGFFVVRKSDGRLREHTCLPARPVLPSMA